MKIRLTFLLLIICFIANGQSPQVDELGKLYMSGKYDQAITKANDYLKNDTDNIYYKLILGRALTDIGNYNEAIPYLQFAADRDNSWIKAWALGYLGSCYYMLADYKKSESALKACVNLNATESATNYSYRKIRFFGYNSFYKDWTVKESKNFRFHFQKMSDTEIDMYISSREIAYKKINEFFECSLPKKIDFYVWDSMEDAKNILRENLGFAEPNSCIVHSYYQQTIGHEMTHVISNYTSHISNKTTFINEGTAVYFDQSNRDMLKKVKVWIESNNKQIVIKDYWEKGREYAEEILYPLSGLFVKELIDNFGREKFLEFFKNQSYENAKLVFGNKLDKVIKDFENKINT